MNDIWQSVLRTSLSYLLLMVITLIWGKQINSQKNHFNFALAISIGSFIANMSFDLQLHFIPMCFSILTLTAFYLLSSFLSFKIRKLRKWLSGQPVVLIEKGNILEINLEKSRFTMDDLTQHLREQGVFNINEVEYAILEVSGNVSVLKREKFNNVTKMDIHLSPNNKQFLPLELIVDGKLIEENLSPIYSRDWIMKECENRQIQLNDVFYAVIGTNGQIYFDLYKKDL